MGDNVVGSCLHTYQSTSPSPGGPVPTPVPMTLPFQGKIMGPCAPTVTICGMSASVVGDNVVNQSVHPPVGGASIPGPPVPPATNKATLPMGSKTVMICGKPAIRTGDKSTPECGLAPGGGPATVMAGQSTVNIGG